MADGDVGQVDPGQECHGHCGRQRGRLQQRIHGAQQEARRSQHQDGHGQECGLHKHRHGRSVRHPGLGSRRRRLVRTQDAGARPQGTSSVPDAKRRASGSHLPRMDERRLRGRQQVPPVRHEHAAEAGPARRLPRIVSLRRAGTELGSMTSQMIGRGFTANKLTPDAIISSPALRCVQTANNLVKAMDNKGRVGIETSLFDFPGWYEQVPVWMDDAEMNAVGIPVDGNYTPVETRDAIHERKGESYTDFQKRVATSMTSLLEKHKDKSNVILVTHGTTMDAIARARGLLGQEAAAMSAEQMNALGSMFPFCSLAVFDEQEGKWKMIDDPMPYITYLDFNNAPSQSPLRPVIVMAQ